MRLIWISSAATLLAVTLGCSSGGITHTVPDAAVARVQGDDKARIAAAKAQVVQAENRMKGYGQAKKQAETNVVEAEKGIAAAQKQLDELEKQIEQRKQAVERAELKKQLREQELELIEKSKGVIEAEVVVARARYELEKFQIVGRVESGSQADYQGNLAGFRDQLNDAQIELAGKRDDVSAQQARIKDLKAQLGEK